MPERAILSVVASTLSSGGIALAGAVIGAGASWGGQWIADRRARRTKEMVEVRRYRAALKLLAMDLERSLRRLGGDAVKRDPRGYMELPRGAWLEYRPLLVRYLPSEDLALVSRTYNQIIEWNTILWAAYGDSAPPTFHKADQHKLGDAEAAALLSQIRPDLEKSIKDALGAVGAAYG